MTKIIWISFSFFWIKLACLEDFLSWVNQKDIVKVKVLDFFAQVKVRKDLRTMKHKLKLI